MKTAALPDWSRQVPERLEVIVKVAERCNINCRYCYVFNGADDSYRFHPATISDETTNDIIAFLSNGARELGLRGVQVDFHGGEPLLLGKKRLSDICMRFRKGFESGPTLTLCIQTNGTLIDDTWIDIFARHRLNVGISIDGPPEYHDVDRVDFQERGTYARVRNGIELVQEAARAGRLNQIGVLCVINPRHSARKIFRHIVDELHVDSMDFLLPNATHDSADETDQDQYGRFLCELWEEWSREDNPRLQVRILNSVLSLLIGGRAYVTGFGLSLAPAITVASDGSLGPDDLLRSCGKEMMIGSETVKNTCLREFLQGARMRRLFGELGSLSGECLECCWLRVCGGGAIVNRYKRSNGFANPSVFCPSLKMFFREAANSLLSKGLPVSHLINSLAEKQPSSQIAVQ